MTPEQQQARERVRSLRAQAQDRECRGFWPDVVEWLCDQLEATWKAQPSPEPAAPTWQPPTRQDYERTQCLVAALAVALAKRVLRNWQNDDGRWPGRQEWTDLAGSSHGTLLEHACQEAGVHFDTFDAVFRAHPIDINWDAPLVPTPPRSTPTPAQEPSTARTE